MGAGAAPPRAAASRQVGQSCVRRSRAGRRATTRPWRRASTRAPWRRTARRRAPAPGPAPTRAGAARSSGEGLAATWAERVSRARRAARRGTREATSLTHGATAPPAFRPRNRASVAGAALIARRRRARSTKSPGVDRVAFLEAARLRACASGRAACPGLPQIITRSSAGFERRQAEVVGELAGLEQLGDAAHVAELLARDGRVVEQLASRPCSPRNSCLGRCSVDEVVVGQLVDLAHAVHQDDLLEASRRSPGRG